MTGDELAVLARGEVAAPLPMVENDTDAGDGDLRSASVPISADDPNLDLLVSRMRASLAHEKGVGIAAPQIGVNRRVAIVQRQDKADEPFEVYLNLTLTKLSEETVMGWEGCLSVPAGFGEVERSVWVQVEYDGPGGERASERVEGWTARIFQHEVDHLDGVLFIDRMAGDKTLMPKDEYREMRRLEKEAETAPAVDQPAPDVP
jgi:peptide deformylase